ncbi:WXG100 family type VII secretion target [Mycolicibacterium fortuitum]|uniref:WXG100 family type VII secretion target n=1 Tax=Mycolicibacterium fortuitum TaxID=1766 RepID=UPI001CE18723|nr:WXG100 family type VII secretion target [Mycolicibacterium fortuitum]MCA4727335.1 WXG100 family type VII secretion target [Mycolicibacterium fortuitum]
MSEPLHTDEAALATAASDYDRIAGEITARLRAVQAEADGLVPNLRGQTGTAAQAAAARYSEAANAEVVALQQIATDIHGSGRAYGSTDTDGASLVNVAFPGV